MDRTPNQWGYVPHGSDVYFCSQACKFDWLSENMQNIERGIPVPFIRERRISEGYEKATKESQFGYRYTSIQKIEV
jgi:YHS domain-containing protein